MSCRKYEQFEMGYMDRDRFQKHAESCPSCQSSLEEDKRLMELSKSLKEPWKNKILWSRIENRLRDEARKTQKIRLIPFPDSFAPAFRIAAVMIVIIGMSLIFWPMGKVQSSGLLSDAALRNVEKTEQAYERAISKLASSVQPKLSKMDLELVLLYRDRLETIDSQILQCREALNDNPANAHIRRYMLTALQDKKETLKEIDQLKKAGSQLHEI